MLDGFFLLRVQSLQELLRARKPGVVAVPGVVAPGGAVGGRRRPVPAESGRRPVPAGDLVRAAGGGGGLKGPSE